MQPTNPRPVMDIRPQRPAPQPIQRPNFAAAAAPAPAAPAPVAPAPVEQPPAPQLPPEEHHEVQPTPAVFPAELPKVKTPKTAIFIAVLVGASLIGLTVFGYMKSQEKAEVANTPTAQTVTAEDVDTSVADTDAALDELDDAADFNSTELSDDSLGL